MKTHLILSLAVPFLVALPSCSRNAEEISALIGKIEDLEAGSRDITLQVSEQRRVLQAASRERERAAVQRGETENLIRKTRIEMEAVDAQFSAYRQDYRRAVQSRAKGMPLPDFAIGSTDYSRVVVSSATDTELTVLTNEGVAKVPLASAPLTIQAMFGYDPSTESPGPNVRSESAAYLDRVIAEGKTSAQENKRLLADMKAASQKKRPVARAPEASACTKAWDWRNTSSFEGSFYAPLRKR